MVTSSTAIVIAAVGISSGLFGVAILHPNHPWFFIPLCIVFSLVGSLTQLSKAEYRTVTKVDRAVSVLFCAIFGALIGAAATKYVWVAQSFPGFEFLVGAGVAFIFGRLAKPLEKLQPQLIEAIKKLLEKWLS